MDTADSRPASCASSHKWALASIPTKTKPLCRRPSRNTKPLLDHPVSLSQPALVKTNEGDCLTGAHTASAMMVAATDERFTTANPFVIESRTLTMKSCASVRGQPWDIWRRGGGREATHVDDEKDDQGEDVDQDEVPRLDRVGRVIRRCEGENAVRQDVRARCNERPSAGNIHPPRPEREEGSPPRRRQLEAPECLSSGVRPRGAHLGE